MADEKKCLNCGHMNSLKHIYCMKCGEQLVANNDTSIEKLSRLGSIRNVKKKHFFKGPIKKKQKSLNKK